MKVCELGAPRARVIAACVSGGFALVAGFAAPQFAQASILPPVLAPVPASAALQVLSPADVQRYGLAFSAMRRGDVIAGQNAAHGITDPCLMGRLQAIRLLNPNYTANYPELKTWLDQYADLPEAARIYDLAMKRRPQGAPAPRGPAVADTQAPAAVSLSAERTAPPVVPAANSRQQAARTAFYKGDIDAAYSLAAASGERWIAGLSAVRLKKYPEALHNLGDLAADPKQNPWVRSAAAYWAARAATAVNDAPRANELLKTAARSPDTFYGLIATRELDQASAKSAKESGAAVDPIADVLAAEAVDPAAVAALVRSDAHARRAAALMQIGSPLDAGEDLRAGFASANAADRAKLTSLAIALNAPLGKPDAAKAGWARFDMGHFPTPQLFPRGGFTVDKALIYALVRQESRFNANSVSGSGAYGLMQLTAATATRLAAEHGLSISSSDLRDPALNLRLGQDYVAKLLTLAKGDVMRAVASYNGGPGVIKSMVAKMGDNADSLMMIESMPSGQTRDYVQRVVAGYWIYRQIFGQDSATLDAAAAGVRAVASADR
ncbi:MAG: transglycosylase SLT domain-containing protein [Caulobacteraceae bacterium]